MRILVVSNLYPPDVRGGYEIECQGVVDRLRASHEVLVLTSRRRRVSPDAPHVLRRLPFLEHRRRDSILAPLTAVQAAATSRETISAFRPDLIFVWNGAQIPHSAIVQAARSGRPLAFRACEHWFGRLYRGDRFARHLYGDDRGLRRAWAAGMRAANAHPLLRIGSDAPVPVTVCWNSDALRRAAGRPEGVEVVLERVVHPSVPDLEGFRSVERVPLDEPTILFVGRLGAEKGVGVAIDALASLNSRHGTHAQLLVAGDGSPAAVTELRARARALGARVELLGARSRADLKALLGRAHALVMPSLWDEPAGLVLVEAALARVPLVASRIGGIPELFEDERHALLFSPGDPEDCADQLARVLEDPAAAQQRASRAARHAERFTFEPYIEAIEDFLAQSLTKLSRARRSEASACTTD